jgi:hypothetical protein
MVLMGVVVDLTLVVVVFPVVLLATVVLEPSF